MSELVRLKIVILACVPKTDRCSNSGHSTWLVTSLSPGSERISKHSSPAGDGKALLNLLPRLWAKSADVTGRSVRIAVIQEAGLDGFWVHRLLEANGIESHVSDPASIAVPRRQRRAKTDVIDGETLLRTLLAWKRGEPRVCSMVVPPSPEQEDRRRICRERAVLLQERVRHVNRIKGLLSGQGIIDYEPLHRDRREQLDELRTGDGRPLPARLKAELLREIEVIELLMRQIAEVEAERDAAIEPEAESQASPIAPGTPPARATPLPRSAGVRSRVRVFRGPGRSVGSGKISRTRRAAARIRSPMPALRHGCLYLRIEMKHGGAMRLGNIRARQDGVQQRA